MLYIIRRLLLRDVAHAISYDTRRSIEMCTHRIGTKPLLFHSLISLQGGGRQSVQFSRSLIWGLVCCEHEHENLLPSFGVQYYFLNHFDPSIMCRMLGLLKNVRCFSIAKNVLACVTNIVALFFCRTYWSCWQDGYRIE